MNTSRPVLLAVILGGVILLALLAWLVFAPAKKSTPPAGNPTLPTAGSEPGVVGPVSPLSLQTGTGTSIPAKNFLADSATVADPVNTGHYFLGYHYAEEGISDQTATPDPPYTIEYIAKTQYFGIVLLHEPLGKTRREAETYLMQALGVSQDEMCQLKYQISAPNRVSTQYAGVDLRFSFCPGAVVLP